MRPVGRTDVGSTATAGSADEAGLRWKYSLVERNGMLNKFNYVWLTISILGRSITQYRPIFEMLRAFTDLVKPNGAGGLQQNYIEELT